MKHLALQHVQFVPKQLEPGILYVSREFAVAAHLCACGCGNKVSVPLGPAEWTLFERDGRATLRPSIGNWQLPCRSHYLIIDGRIDWAPRWTDEQIADGRQSEERRREAYYKALEPQLGFVAWIWAALLKFLGLRK
ncbi:DUF6527 family protein [Mesorhizobium escarrei]|uniref:DUF968 domain-containing protein n=1 Tax=Mesorhizobium escarrei TaxID=666018 RepID=A0ABM9E1U3_9HYPH|nr:DUF6527 family protein [Mesorhizobium escarrei]CAH2403060.1 hypothetical protein MES5069_360136 [Mesorhizobium escarrei]